MKYLLPFLAILLLSSCKSLNSMENSPNKMPSNFISVSQGGGYTGAYETYYLLESGEIYVKADADSALYGNLSHAATDSLFAQARELKLQNKAYSNPGNMNYSLLLRLENSTYKATWADEMKPEMAILSFYKKVLLRIKSPKR